MRSTAFRIFVSTHFVALLWIVTAPGASAADSKDQFVSETAPTFRASDLLVSEVLRGPSYELEDFVQVEQGKYTFKIRSEWGTIPAHGLHMLELKLREIHAIENTRKRSKDPQFTQGVFAMVKNTPQGVRVLLTEPDGALLRAPTETTQLLRLKFEPSDRRAGDEFRRRLAVDVGCDPETTNPMLKGLLDGLAQRNDRESPVANPLPQAGLPGLTLLALNAEIRELVVSKSPQELNTQIEHDLEALAIPEQIRIQFCQEVNYTTTQRLLFMHYLRHLRNVQNVHILVEAAVEARNEAEGLAVIHELKLLNDVHLRDPIREVSDLGMPLASTHSGKHVIVSASDYIMLTRDVAEVMNTRRRDFPKTPTTLYTSGRVSALAMKAFTGSNIEVLQR